jgi:uncharacterized protein
MLNRDILEKILLRLSEMPAVALLGPRQVGKTTVALQIAQAIAPEKRAIYFDLESTVDRGKLDEPEAYLANHENDLVILDEIHRLPGLFPVLRGLIDTGRRKGNRTARFLLLGSASMELLKQSGETLAGRISYIEMTPFNATEVQPETDKLWLRGGFPESFLAKSDAASFRWRSSFIRTYLEREVLQFSPRLEPNNLATLWRLIATQQGSVLNVALLSRHTALDVKTVQRYLDLLDGMMLLRRLQPWSNNSGKRLVKSPKVYVRDSGVLHGLLNFVDHSALINSVTVGASWEGFVIENLLSVCPENFQAYFYRSSGGAEIDVVLQRGEEQPWLIEIKRSLAPSPSKGFQEAASEFNNPLKYLVYPGSETFPVRFGVIATSLSALMALLKNASST